MTSEDDAKHGAAGDHGATATPASRPSKRRWPWLVVALLLTAILAPIAWQYRPLNQAERRLVGTWIEAGGGNDLGALDFRPDRSWFPTTFMPDPRRPGFRNQVREQLGELTWSCSGATLRQIQKHPLAADNLEELLFAWAERIFSSSNVRQSEVEFDGPDRVTIDGRSYERFDERSPDVWRSRRPDSDSVPASPMPVGGSSESAPAE